MFTSRAEHRLALRCDNVVDRLLETSRRIGLLSGAETARLEARRTAAREMHKLLQHNRLHRTTLRAILRRDAREAPVLEELPGGGDLRRAFWTRLREAGLLSLPGRLIDDAVFQVVNDLRYRGYIEKQDRLLREQAHLEAMEIPGDFPYHLHPQISFEARDKLRRIKPSTMAQASRIDGVRASDLSLLAILVQRYRRVVNSR